jgi:hypothetical protein
LRYTPGAGFTGQAVIPVSVNDEGRTGNGGAQSNTVNLQVNVTPADSTPPAVAEVLVSGSAWTDGFLNFLQAGGLGAGGFLVPGGAAQLSALPWANLNRITIRFSDDVNVQVGDLRVRGVTFPNYGFGGFTYTPATRTAVWALTTLGAEKLLLDLNATDVNTRVTNLAGLALDGEWNNGADSYPSGNGTAGGDFEFRVNVLAGDADGSGTVDVADLGTLATNFNQTNRGPRHGDFDGDAAVNVTDLGTLATNFNRSLPAGNPALAAPASRGRPPTARATAPLLDTGPRRRPAEALDLLD